MQCFVCQGIADALTLITDQRITIDMAIQQLQQLTPYWWAVGEAAGMQRAALKEVSVILSLLSVLCTSICSAVYLSNCTTMCTYSLSSRYGLTTRGMQKSHLRRWCTRSSYLTTPRGPSWLVSVRELGLLTWPPPYWIHTPLVRLTVCSKSATSSFN